MTPHELIHACRDGDQRAWRDLVQQYARLVYSIPARAGLSPADCDDVFQSVFASLLANLHQLRDAQALPAWFIVTARRATVHRQRALARESLDSLDHDTPSATPEQEVERLERQQIVEEGLQALGHRCEQLLRACFHHHPPPSYDELARRFAMPASSIGPTRTRCLARLAQTLESLGLLERLAGPRPLRAHT